MDDVSYFRPWEPRAARPAGTGCVGAAKGKKKKWIKKGEARTPLHGLDHDDERRTELGFVDLLGVLDLSVPRRQDNERNTALSQSLLAISLSGRSQEDCALGRGNRKLLSLNFLVIF